MPRCPTPLALLAVALFLGACAEASQSIPDGLEIVKADAYDVSPRLSELAKQAVTTSLTEAQGERARVANPPRRIRQPELRRSALPADPTVQTLAGAGTIPSPIANFEGMGTGLSGFLVQSAPPDPIGDIGPDHYIQTVNFSLAVFSRTGDLVLGPMPTRALWADFAGACAMTNDGDATVRYDHLAQRWVIAQFSVNGGQGPFYQCVAVSTSSDPMGTYNRYQFAYGAFNDYPKMALWPGAYYFTFNMFQKSEFLGAKSCAMDRTRMLAGGPATMQCFTTGPDEGGLLVSDLDGKVLPAKGTPAVVATFGTDELQLWRMHADFGKPSNSYFTGPVRLAVVPFAMMCDGGSCVRQPDVGQTLDAVSDRPMNRLPYRKFATHEVVLLSHAVKAGASGGMRWYEIRNPTSDRPVLHQQGTYAPDNGFRFMGSIAMDAIGNIAMGYSASSSSLSPSVRYTGRVVSDPLGTFGQGEGVMAEGFGAQTGGLSRFGDYSSLTIDPVDDCTFWYTQEYIGEPGSFNWRTRVASFKFPSCGSARDDFSLVSSPSKISFLPGQTTDVVIETKVLSGAAQSVSLTATGLPPGVTASFSPATVTAGQVSVLTFTAAAGAEPGSAQVEVTGTGSLSHTTSVALTVRAPGTTVASAPSGAGDPRAGLAEPAALAAPCQAGSYQATSLPVAIPDNSPRGARATVEVPSAGLVEALTLTYRIRHPYRQDLIVALVSPGGVRHVLANRQGGAADDLVAEAMAVPTLRGQPAYGKWTLEVQDRAGQDVGEVQALALAVVASCAGPRAEVVGPGRPLIDQGRMCSTTRVVESKAAKVALSLSGHHTFRSSLRASLAFGGREVAVLARGALADGAGRFSARTELEAFSGSAAGDWTLCIEDLDGHGDIGELERWSLELR